MVIIPDDPGDRLRMDGILEVSRLSRSAAFYPYRRDCPAMDLQIATPGAQLAVEAWLAGVPAEAAGEEPAA
jgi:hypothetical protein